MCCKLFKIACTAIREAHFDIRDTQLHNYYDSRQGSAGLINLSGKLIPGAVKEETLNTFCQICSSDYMIIL